MNLFKKSSLVSGLLAIIILLSFSTSAFAYTKVSVTTPFSDDQADPSMFNYQPNIEWFQDDTEGDYFSTFWINIYDENWNLVWTSGITTQNTYQKLMSIPVNTALPRYTKLIVTVGVQDGTGEWDIGGYPKWMYLTY
ncbi:hypothetical protein [Paenibacillus flagellatus]|uniref:Uncharacterized protein n=1 Tax=Paenibacillus flagellatus TaxID=2211139 RepID=A0A2V5KXJ6_9BACL|nr:hypothetical protein [Paenibacillus flagellatus]PYI57177.1 hypothetical protein DLM86_01680 [Paenibacillus flagellatus]